MCRKTSKRQSGRPASRTSTRVPGSSDSRLASTQPAPPPPTMTKSNRSSIERRSYQRDQASTGPVGGLAGRWNHAYDESVAALAVVVGGHGVGERAWAARRGGG